MAIKSSEVAEVLRNKLQEGEVNFTFIKKDGTRRPAVGTLNFDLIPEAATNFKNSGQTVEREDQITYYDLEKMMWRSCKVANMVEINGETIEED